MTNFREELKAAILNQFPQAASVWKGSDGTVKTAALSPDEPGRPGHHTGGSKQASAFGCGDSKDQGIPAWNA